ncbi:sugar phosphate isomerase/epimerase [Paenibacillus sp. HWE-109]|uniref:sugar phosphate isomerase/epimerase family protein n=1 Tax=Paenibacillus sp. HWE-109 TaxID=1306526 RepID=UPI001EE0A42F|nr:sugar phosphate isomerase/epimerase [Paenibacillus sp. HWE-109]UKS24119.1 sugar phosphate isomerase/epimerase [Paenibacillus sp. HWE-109]
MQMKMIKALWGMDGSLEEQFERIHKAGYKGIESPLPAPEYANRFRELLIEYQLDYIAMVFTNADNHAGSFEQSVEQAALFNPILINSHSAKDSMPWSEQIDFFTKALAIEQRIGLPIGHETHRGRAMFTPWGTAELLKELPDLRLTADFSHWCCVCESLLEDQAANLAVVMERVIHIHGRIGYAQGPQVPDPAAPEYAQELQTHEGWWRQIAEQHRAKGRAEITFTPEFGPPGYMHTLPFTNQPVADLWDVCLWMATHMSKRQEEWFSN